MLDTSLVAPTAPALALRPYQETCVARVLATYARQPRGGKALVVLPTGGGKTIVFAEIARRLNLTTLIIAHRQELLQQAADKFRLIDPTALIGQVGAGRHEWGAPITVASVQTISRPEHLKALRRFGYELVIIDECHHSASAGYQAVLDVLPQAFVVGVTATPDRLDNQSIERIFGEPVFSVSILDLIRQGYLCDLRAIAVHTTTSLDDLHIQGGDFKQDELEEVIDTPERNERVVRAYLQHCAGRQALCFAVTVNHAWNLAQAFKRFHIPAEMVSGDTPPEERRRILHDYERGDLQVLCNVGVLTEGYDAPQTSCIVMTRPTKSRALYTQCIGRGTRLAPEKQNCIILDITDNCLKHRLQPLTLGRALGKVLHDGESVTEAAEREEREARERQSLPEVLERTTKVTKRGQDLTVNILAPLDWKRRPGGAYLLEVGERKHRIMLVPSRETDGYYSVQAWLAPNFQKQQWLKDSPLDWAQQHAEMKARLLLSDETKLILVDNNAAWRTWPATEKQLALLRRFKISFGPDITRGEASDLIGREQAARAKKKAEKQASKSARGKRKVS